MALIPVCSGCFTGCRSTTPGARRSSGLKFRRGNRALCRRSARPSAFTTRPIMASPTGIDMMRPVRFTWSPSLIDLVFAQQHGADLVFFQVQRDADTSSGRNSTNSPAITFSRP